jgi:hypothetical protein
MRIDSSGNVAIGTTDASNQRLKIKQSADTGAASFSFKIEANANDTGLFLGYRGVGAATAADTCAILASFTSTGAFKPITFLTSDAERMRIDSSGNVGIGISSPTQTAANRTVLSVNGTTTAIINLNAGGVNKSYFYYDGTNTNLNTLSGLLTLQNDGANAITFNTNGGNERMRIDSSGNLLVGTSTSVGARLYVIASGASAIRGDASTATTVAMYGVHSSNSSTGYVAYFINTGAVNGQYLTNTGAWQAISDARLKTDVKNLDSTSRLLQLRPVDYLWKSQETSEEPSKRSFGFIAQEVKEVFPELVTVSPDGMFGVEYTGLISPLVKAIQEQQALIQSLTTRITALEAK